MTVVGVDEAGRGPLAGPVLAAAVTLSEAQKQELTGMGLRDSKKLSPKKRELIFSKILSLHVTWRACSALPSVIDSVNILRATLWAMRRAVERLPVPADIVLVDGNVMIPELQYAQKTVVGGDDIYPEISAASVIAKVLRDRIMQTYDGIYPGYSFAKHKGYGTAAHYEALRRHGVCPIHRISFLKNFL